MGILKRVHFTGKINKKYMSSGSYKDATVFVFASVSEVHPMVTLEACAAGLPLVVAKDDAFSDVVIDKKNGFLLPLNKNQFVGKLLLLLSDKNLRTEMGNNSLKLIDENFPAEVLTDRLLKIYAQVLAAKPEEKRLQRINKAAVRRLVQTTKILDRFFTN